MTHYGELAALLSGSNPHPIDGGLCDVGSLLRLVQLMLDLPEPHRMAAHLLLLVDTQSLALLLFFRRI